MKLSLSVRVGEPPKQKDVTAIPFPELAAKAKALGFAGVSMRASVVSVDSPPERVREVRHILDDVGLGVSAVCGDIPLAANDADAVRALRGITPYLDLTEAMGSRLVRVMMQTEDDIPFARRAADEAAERGLTLMHINHWGTLFESVDESLETLAAIGRSNFQVAFEPGNLLSCRAPHGPDALARLAPHLVNVFFQNVRLDPASPIVFHQVLTVSLPPRHRCSRARKSSDISSPYASRNHLGYSRSRARNARSGPVTSRRFTPSPAARCGPGRSPPGG